MSRNNFSPLATVAALIILTAALLPFFNGCSSRFKGPVNLVRDEVEGESQTAAQQSAVGKKGGKVVWVQRPIDSGSVIDAVAKNSADYLMNFENITLPDFIEAMMTGVFKKNYLITDNVKALNNRFTIKMSEDLKGDRAFQLFTSILSMYNVAARKRENTYIFDTVKNAAVTLKGPLVYGRNVPEGFSIAADDEVTFMVPFYNISPETVKAIITAQLPPQSIVFPIPELNLLVLNGNLEDIRYTLSFIELLDRAQFKDKTVLMIKPEYWDIDEFEMKVKMLLDAEGIAIEWMEKTKGILFIPIEKLNSLIVISSVKEWVERVLYWLEQLDVPEAAGESKKVYAYKLKNVDVESVADVLQSYRTGSISTGMRSNTGDGGFRAPGTTDPAKGVKDDKSKSAPKSANKTSRPRSSGRSGMGIGGDENAIDDVAVIPVVETNSIVLVATPVEYKKYLDIIKRIDVPRNQVFVEVIIGEVSLDKSTQLGLEFWINRYLYRTSFGTKGGLGVYRGSDETGNNIVPSGSNFFVNGSMPGTQFEVLINALMENSKINIISTPKITVLENVEAEISVGSDVPVIASESGITPGGTGGTGNLYPFRSVQYISTGIILKVTASILSGNKIALDIEQEISEALENKKSDISSPEILKRTIKTTMVVQEGAIAFIGGLFQNKSTSSGSGIPILSSIPLLGNLFKNTKKQLKKTELVIFINAKTIRKNNDMKEIVEGVKKMFSDRINIKSNAPVKVKKPDPTGTSDKNKAKKTNSPDGGDLQ